MNKVIILVTFSVILCSTVTAQDGSGKSTKQNSGTKSAGVAALRLTRNLKEQLAAEMVKNAFNPEWFRKCMEEAGGIDKIVDIEVISLSNSESPQYLLSGKIVENGESCAFGARSPMYWIFENRGGRIRLLADIGAADSVKVISQRTNGYRDIQIGAVYNAGRSFSTTYMKIQWHDLQIDIMSWLSVCELRPSHRVVL